MVGCQTEDTWCDEPKSVSAGEEAQETGGSRKIVKSSARSLDIVLRAHGVKVARGDLDGEG